MFAELQRHRLRGWVRREYLMLRSWNELARSAPADARLVAFFGSSNLFWPYSMDRQLSGILARLGTGDVVLNLGSFGFGDSSHVLSTTLALIEAYRHRPIGLLVFEVTANEMPPLDKDMARTFLRHDGRARLVRDHGEAAPVVERLRGVRLPLLDNLRRLAEVARAVRAPFPILLLDYESNLRQWAPSFSFFSHALGAADAAAYRTRLARAIQSVRHADWDEARHDLDACTAIDPDVALTAYLEAKIAEARGDMLAAGRHYRRARDLDLVRGRLSRAQLLPDLPDWCAQLGLWYVSVPAVVHAVAGHDRPGFGEFVDDVHYRPHVHYAIAQAIACRLHSEGWLRPSPSTVAAEDVVAAANGQQLFTQLQGALNLVLLPHSPYNDERVAEGLRHLDDAARLGADPVLLEQYRLRFSLLAGLHDEAADLLERRTVREIDPLALALGLQAEPRPVRAQATARSTTDEIGPRLDRLLLSRCGIHVTPENEQTDLLHLGLDSLGIAELLMTVEQTFDVSLTEQLFDRQLTVVTLRDLVAAKLVETPTRRMAYEKSLARQAALARARPRQLDTLHLEPAAVVANGHRPAAWGTGTIAGVLEQQFRRDPERPAIALVPSGAGGVDRTVDWTWGDLDRASARMAAFLYAQGVRAGHVVYLLTGHGTLTVSLVVGALRLGAVAAVGHAPSPRLTADVFAETFGELVRRAAPRVVIVSSDLERLIETCLTAADLGAAAPRLLSYDLASAWAARDDLADWPRAAARPDDLAVLQHSSGTTGARKAVMLTHRELLGQAYHYARAIDLRHDDRIVSWLPLYHDMGLIACFLLPLLTATPVTLMSPFDWVAAPQLLFEAISRDRGTLVWLPNFAFHLLAERVRPESLAGIDLSSVRAIINCSEPVGFESWQRFYDRFAFHGLSRFAYGTCYALAENVFAVTQGGIGEPVYVDFVDAERLRQQGRAVPCDPRLDEAHAIRPVPSSGTPLPSCRVRVVAPGGDRAVFADRLVGEIEVASAWRASGYYHNDEATAASFHGEWYRTGDLGYLAGGQLFVLGRKTDVIVVSGVNVFADDIERIVSSVAGVKPGRVAAFGLRDERRGTERVIVLFERAAGSWAAAAESVEIVAQRRLNDALQLAGCRLIEIPAGAIRKTSSGKVARRRMKQLYESGQFGSRAGA